MGMLWSTGAMAGTVKFNLVEVGELAENIHGIGPSLARALVNYRNQYCDFALIEELTGGRGIGSTIIEANRSVIVVKDVPLETQIDVTSD